MSESNLRSPGDVARELKISPSTLRRWSTEFADFLSETAGRLEISSQGESAHRRYTDDDVRLLGSINELLNRGLTYREIAAQLERARQDPDEEIHDDQLSVVPTRSEAGAALSSTFSFLTNTMDRVVEGQQVVLSSQQANRDLLGIVIQDNFNLKEENSRLRDRMLQLERNVSELERRAESLRGEVMERLLDIEAKNDDSAAQEDVTEPRPKGCLSRWFGVWF